MSLVGHAPPRQLNSEESRFATLYKLYEASRNNSEPPPPVLPDWEHIEETELAKEVPDYDLVAEARIHLENQKPAVVEPREFESWPIVCRVTGISLLVATFGLGLPIYVYAFAFFLIGLPAVVREPVLCLWLVVTLSTGLGLIYEGVSSSDSHQAVREAQVRLCQKVNHTRTELNQTSRLAQRTIEKVGGHLQVVRLPLRDCSHLQGR